MSFQVEASRIAAACNAASFRASLAKMPPNAKRPWWK
jgi:hypothetical protein